MTTTTDDNNDAGHEEGRTGMSALQARAALRQPPPDTWVLVLNRYQRDNLLWLFNAIGYGMPGWHGVEPFNFANTGDWAGEIPQMLAKEDGTHFGSFAVGEDDHPNCSLEELKRRIALWLESQQPKDLALRPAELIAKSRLASDVKRGRNRSEYDQNRDIELILEFLERLTPQTEAKKAPSFEPERVQWHA